MCGKNRTPLDRGGGIFRRLGAFCALFALLLLPLAPQDCFCANREVRAGIFGMGGYHEFNEDEQLVGYGIDLLKLLSEYSHLNFELIGYEKSWRDMQEMLRNGEIDVVSSARRTPAREKEFIFSLPVGRNLTVLSVRKDDSTRHGGDYSTYEGMIIGQILGSSQNKLLEEFARQKGFTFVPKIFDDPDKMTEALQNGEIDAILASNLRKGVNEKTLDVIQADNFYMMARKDSQDIINEINYAIQQMNLNEGDWENTLHFRHYEPEANADPVYTRRELNYMMDVGAGHKKITATARDGFPPYSWVEDGHLRGILPDFFSQVMTNVGLNFDLVPPKDAADYERMANQNEVDIVLDSISTGAPRVDEEILGFATEPYMTTGIAQVMRNDFKGNIKKIAMAGHSPLQSPPDNLKNAELILYPSSEEAMKAVLAGKADAALVMPHTAQQFVNRDAESPLIFTLLNDKGATFRMYVPKDVDHELVSILKKSLRSMPRGSLDQLITRYTSLNARDMSFGQFMAANPSLMYGGAFTLLFGLSLIGFLLLRGHFNRRLLAATENANRELSQQLSIVEALSRDYLHVYEIDQNQGTLRVVKVQGYVPPGLNENSPAPQSYDKLICHSYVGERVHPDDREMIASSFELSNITEKLDSQGEYSGTYRIMENGEVHYVQFTFVRIPERANPNLILAGLRNIDELVGKEHEQKELLTQALAQARYASAAKTAFLNNMSHDIRTPMNAIIGFTSLAISHFTNSALVRDYLGKIMTSGNHLLSLINDVLDMSRIESGKMQLDEKENSLPDIIHSLKSMVQADVKSKQINFCMDALDVSNETIYCDRLRLNQVLLNILGNAMKYTQPGGKVTMSVIQTGAAEDGMARYEFIIADTGIGMSREFLKNVFEPFEREKTSTISGIQGTGLGLAITKNIVDMMGGTIAVESEPGVGSEFRVAFHFRVVEKEEVEEPLPELVGKRALVVDDDVTNCTGVCRQLSLLEMKPDWTTLGAEAIVRANFAREQNDPYELYLIDWIMPDMNGIELTRRLRQTVGPDVPIIVMSAYDWSDIMEEARAAGVTSFCSKPVFLSTLKEILAAPQGGSEKGAEIKKPDFGGKRLLLAEDNELNQEIAQMILEDAGFELDIVNNGAEAVEAIENAEAGHYDLVLMDVQMPVMDGYEATRKIRVMTDPAKASIPIVAMTANAFSEDRKRARDIGMNGYVDKPVDQRKLMKMLERLLGKGN